MNIDSLVCFVKDYPELTPKFKLVIHIEAKSKENDILLKQFQDSPIPSTQIKTIIFVGHSQTPGNRYYFPPVPFAHPVSPSSRG